MSLVDCDVRINMSGINSQLAKLKDQKALEAAVKKIAFGLYADIVKATPVDTGRAKGGWNIKPKSATAYTIGNNVHYVPFLEFGTRRSQKHVGFVRGNIQKWESRAKAIVLGALK